MHARMSLSIKSRFKTVNKPSFHEVTESRVIQIEEWVKFEKRFNKFRTTSEMVCTSPAITVLRLINIRLVFRNAAFGTVRFAKIVLGAYPTYQNI